MKYKSIYKILSFFICLLIAVLCAVGCDTGPSNSNDGSNEPDSDDVFVGITDDSSRGDSSAEESIEPQDTVVSFLACPDNIIHPSVFYDAIQRAARANEVEPKYTDLHNQAYDFWPIYENVLDYIENADISYINQETLIGGTSKKVNGYPVFNSPLAVADTVVGMGFDVVNLAHNHMLDSGNTVFLENCNRVFESAGLKTIGYIENQEATNNITVIEAKGIRVAFLAYTYSTNGIPLPSGSKVVIPYFDEALVTKQVALAKQAADVVIASCHWGAEDSYSINSQQKKYAELMCDLEVDVVLGMHPHVIQPMQWMTSDSGYKTLVVYSLGNFVSGMVNGKNMLAGMLSLNIVKDADTGKITVESPLFIPTVTHYEKGSKVASNDTGYRNFKIYQLKDYTQELAATHGVVWYEKSHSSTLIGGKFSRETLYSTLNKYIPKEFLPKEYQ